MRHSNKTLALLVPLLLAGCAGDNEITEEGIRVTRSACPAVGIPAATGDVTLFNPENSRDSNAIDVVAYITNVRTTCDDSGEYVAVTSTFDVHAQRRDTNGPREIVLPYFASVVQGGTNVVSKRLGRVALSFPDGQPRAAAVGTAYAQVLRSAATLPPEIRERITRKRKAGDMDAALDPMAAPEVQAAVRRSSFEVMIGFQLTQDQLAYNATR